MTEDWASVYVVYMVLLPLLPIVMAVIWLIRLFRRGRRKWEDEIFPEARDRTEEAIRIRKRKRWERKRGAHEKD